MITDKQKEVADFYINSLDKLPILPEFAVSFGEFIHMHNNPKVLTCRNIIYRLREAANYLEYKNEIILKPAEKAVFLSQAETMGEQRSHWKTKVPKTKWAPGQTSDAA